MSEVKLYLGDCLEILPTLETGSVDAVITSPPYNYNGFNRDGRKREYDNYNDNLSDVEYRQFISDVFIELDRLLKDGGAIYWNCRGRINDWKYLPTYWVIDVSPVPLFQHIIWNFPASSEVAKVKWYPRKEDIYFFSKGKPKTFNENMAQLTDVWKITHETNFIYDHPAPFPLEIPKRAILGSTRNNDVVLDPFMGSGTTGVACVQTGRNFIGVDLSPKYYEIAEKRIKEAQLQLRLGI